MSKFPKEMKWGLLIISFYILWGCSWPIYSYLIKGSLVKPYLPEMNMALELSSPFSNGLLLGADMQGRSLLEVISAGLSYSLLVSISVTTFGAVFGLIIGHYAVKGNKLFRFLLDLVTNLIFIFPSILIAIMIMSVIGPSIKGLIFALMVTSWPSYAKITRGEVKRVMGLSYVEGAVALGTGSLRLFIKIIIPAIIPVLIVNMVLGLSGVIISEAALGFLGLGGSPYSWGALLSSSKTVLLEAPHLSIILSITMGGLIIGLNLLGDGLRDYLDPQKM